MVTKALGTSGAVNPYPTMVVYIYIYTTKDFRTSHLNYRYLLYALQVQQVRSRACCDRKIRALLFIASGRTSALYKDTNIAVECNRFYMDVNSSPIWPCSITVAEVGCLLLPYLPHRGCLLSLTFGALSCSLFLVKILPWSNRRAHSTQPAMMLQSGRRGTQKKKKGKEEKTSREQGEGG